ncbi:MULTISPECIES: relaxase/mobilization nuclease domain-containing protein [unclassified Vibrio]|uniref:relaxase/mobilization nuclease domain-containing protein n=1 Tax=unclassified Vibrio TaxID=2614977 RepID=UPI00352D764E
MIFKEAECKAEIQTAADLVQAMRYVTNTSKGKMEALVPLEVADDSDLTAEQLLLYAANSKDDCVSEYITSNELESADDMVFTENAMVENWSDVIDEMIEANSKNKRCSRPMKHLILSNPEGEDMSKSDWAKAVEFFMKGLGYKNCKWIAFRHKKKGNPHVHIVISRINTLTHKVVPDWKEHERAFPLVRQIEKDFNLTRLASPGDFLKPVKQPDGSYIYEEDNEQKADKRKPHVNEITHRLNAIHAQLFDEKYKPSLTEWMLALRESGVGVQLRFAQKPPLRVTGMSYRIKTKDGQNFIASASTLKGKFGFNGIQQRLTKVTTNELNAARQLSEREARMRDRLEADVIAFTKIKDIRLLAQVAFDVQAMMDEQFFAKRMRKPNRKNYKVHRRDGRYCVSQRIKMTALKRLGKMTKSEYEAMINRKFAECLIEMIWEFFGRNEADPVKTKEMYDSGELMHALSPDEGYVQLHGINLNNEVITESQHEVITLPKNIPEKPKKSDSTSPAKTLTHTLDYSPSL